MSRPRPLLWACLLTLTALSLVAGSAAGQEALAAGYPFALPPLEIVDRLAKTDLGPVDKFSADDRKFLEAVWAARSKPGRGKPLTADDTLRAFLAASGVSDPAARNRYTKEFLALVADAKEEVEGAKDDRDRADKLLRFLHAGPMAKGYAEDSTRLSEIFDDNKYNCVSSSALYHLVGTRQGLRLKAVLIPAGYVAGHATLDLKDGDDRVAVEATNADGFDWETKKKQPGVIVLGSIPDRTNGYDTDALGLAASMASNCGLAASTATPPRQAEAVRWYAIALTLDPAGRSASNNLRATLSKWGIGLTKDGRFGDAVKVFAFAAAVAPDDRDLAHNHA